MEERTWGAATQPTIWVAMVLGKSCAGIVTPGRGRLAPKRLTNSYDRNFSPGWTPNHRPGHDSEGGFQERDLQEKEEGVFKGGIENTLEAFCVDLHPTEFPTKKKQKKKKTTHQKTKAWSLSRSPLMKCEGRRFAQR